MYAVAGAVMAFSLVPCLAFVVYKLCRTPTDQNKEEILQDLEPAQDHLEYFLAGV